MIEINKIYNEDNSTGMERIDDASVDVILTDPPYLYLKNKKLDRPFDEQLFFSECKRILKKDGFIVLFGRGSSFYRWNTILEKEGFLFKEEFVWDKGYSTSPLMKISRVHETISLHTKGGGTINRVKVPYLEMKGHDINGICVDLKRFLSGIKNENSLKAVLDFLENNTRDTSDSMHKNNTSVSSHITIEDRSVVAARSIKEGLREKTIVNSLKYESEKRDGQAASYNKGTFKGSDRSAAVASMTSVGMNEKSIVTQLRDHYNTIHPTQKPVRLLERLLALVSKPGDLVCDPFSGSASTAIACINTGRNYIGFEIDKEYYDNSIERINEVLSIPRQGELFG